MPASTSNLGPGLDVFGLALSLWNEMRLLPSASGKWEIVIRGHGVADLPRDPRNLVLRAMRRAGSRFGVRLRPMRLELMNRIPIGAGLGSSGAATVAGVAAAACLAPRRPTFDSVLQLAARIEGHPDNASPALLGGLVACLRDGETLHAQPIPVHPGLRVVVAVPDSPLATRRSRAALPRTVPLADAVFNLGRVAGLADALRSGRFSDLRFLLDDRLHQPRRARLIPGLREAISAARRAGAYGAALSGGGPSIAALCAPARAAAVARAMRAALGRAGRAGRPASTLSLTIEPRGAAVRFSSGPYLPLNAALRERSAARGTTR